MGCNDMNSGCEPSCCDSQGDCGCKCHSCGCCSEMSKDKMLFMMMVDLADEAYMKLAKQKMVEVFEKKMGADMHKSAEFFVEQSISKWMNEEQWMANKSAAMESFVKMMAEKKK